MPRIRPAFWSRCALESRRKSVRGEREIPLAHFFKDFYETTLAPDEILTELIVPDPAPGSHSTYLKYISRSSEDRPCVGMAVVVKNEAGR